MRPFSRLSDPYSSITSRNCKLLAGQARTPIEHPIPSITAASTRGTPSTFLAATLNLRREHWPLHFFINLPSLKITLKRIFIFQNDSITSLQLPNPQYLEYLSLNISTSRTIQVRFHRGWRLKASVEERGFERGSLSI